MKNIFIKVLMLSVELIALARCSNEKDSYYDEPAWVKGSIYEILQDEGRFSNYLQCVDRSLYASSLKGGALYTCFAPNDDAFRGFMSSNGYTSVENIPQSVIDKLVAYSLVYNSYSETELSDILYGGWDTIQSIKKKTPYYETIRREWNGSDSIWVIDIDISGGYTVGDNNYKYLPYYMSRYFNSRAVPLTADDYNTFYPNSTYTGRNVQSATIVSADLRAGNGMIHEIDEVLLPLPSIGQIITENDDYSMYYNLLEKKTPTGIPYFYSYLTANVLTSQFQSIYPSKNIDMVYAKFYGLDVPVNSERFGANLKEAETDGYSVFVPNNNAVTTFFNDKLKDYYTSLDDVPYNILGYFINSQMVKTMVWPGVYKGTMNAYGDYLNGSGARGDDFDRSKFYDIRPASNGFFFGSNDYIKSHYFETVFTEILLNPTYSLLNNAYSKYYESSLKEELMRCSLNGYSSSDYIVLLPSDELLTNDGFTWSWVSSAYTFSHSSTLISAETRIQRLVKSHVFKRINNTEIDTRLADFSGNPSWGYDGYGYAVNDYGDMIRFKNGKIQMLGNYEESDWVTATFEKEFINGKVYTIDKMLQYSRRNTLPSVIDGWQEQPMLTYIQEAAAANPDISMYAEYMTYMLGQTYFPYSISNSSSYTILMPNNDAMTDAISAGYLPPLADVKLTTTIEHLQKAINFMKYHVLSGSLYMNDGYSRVLLPSGAAQQYDVALSTYKVLTTSTFVRVEKDASNNLKFITQNKGTINMSASVVKGTTHSNIFGNKAVLHEIDNALIYIGEDE